MDKVKIVIASVFGALFVLSGLLLAIDYLTVGLCYIAIGLLLIPYVRKLAHAKTKTELSPKARAITILGLFLASGYLMGVEQEKIAKAEEERIAEVKRADAEEKKAQTIAFFNSNREAVLAKISAYIKDREYGEAVKEAKKYSVVNTDEKLRNLYAEARRELEEEQAKKREAELLERAKGVPYEEFENNLDIYAELFKLRPENNVYKDKLNKYKKLVSEKQRKEQAQRERKEKIESQFSAWDGSHRNLERQIERSMNDPSSYDHVETVYWDMGEHLVVRTTFRGKNAFGGIVKNSVKAKVSLDGVVLEILEQY